MANATHYLKLFPLWNFCGQSMECTWIYLYLQVSSVCDQRVESNPRDLKQSINPFTDNHNLIIIIVVNSPLHLPNNHCDVCSENLVLDQLIIP